MREVEETLNLKATKYSNLKSLSNKNTTELIRGHFPGLRNRGVETIERNGMSGKGTSAETERVGDRTVRVVLFPVNLITSWSGLRENPRLLC